MSFFQDAQTIVADPAAYCQGAITPFDQKWCGENIPEDVIGRLTMERFNILLKQINIKKKVGSIYIPETSQADQEWLQGLGVVCRVGPGVYMGKKFEDMGLHHTDGPKVGDLLWFEARAPRRIKIDDELFLSIPDDAIIGRPHRLDIHRFKFTW